MPHYECESPRKNAITPTLQDATACCMGAKCPRNLAPQPGAPEKRPPPKTCSARKFQAIVPENVGGVFSLCFVHLLRSSDPIKKKWKEHVRSGLQIAEVFVWFALPGCCLFGCCWICEPEAAPLEAHMGRNRPSGGFSEGTPGAPVGDSGFGPKFSGRRFFFTLLFFWGSGKCKKLFVFQ